MRNSIFVCGVHVKSSIIWRAPVSGLAVEEMEFFVAGGRKCRVLSDVRVQAHPATPGFVSRSHPSIASGPHQSERTILLLIDLPVSGRIRASLVTVVHGIMLGQVRQCHSPKRSAEDGHV